LKDIISSGAVPVVELIKIVRQAMGNLIITNAHRIINDEEFPKISLPKWTSLMIFTSSRKKNLMMS